MKLSTVKDRIPNNAKRPNSKPHNNNATEGHDNGYCTLNLRSSRQIVVRGARRDHEPRARGVGLVPGGGSSLLLPQKKREGGRDRERERASERAEEAEMQELRGKESRPRHDGLVWEKTDEWHGFGQKEDQWNC